MFDRQNSQERQRARRCSGRYRISLSAICTFFFVIVSAGQLRAATTPITATSPEGINITNAANLLDELGQKQAAQEIKAKLAAGGYSYGNIDGNAETDFATSNLRSSTAISTGFVHFAPGAQSQANRFDFKLRLACLLFHENVHANQGYFNYRKNSFEPPAWTATINMEMTWVALAVQGLPTNLWPGNNPTSGGRALSPNETLALIKELKSYIAEFRAGEGHDPYYGLDPKGSDVASLNAWETYLNSAEPVYQAIVNATATPAAAGTSSPPSGGAASGTFSGANQPGTPAGPSANPTIQPTQANNNPGGTTTPAPQTPPSTGNNTPPDTNQPAPGGSTPQTPSNSQPPAPTNSSGVNLAPGTPGGAATVPGSPTGTTPAPAAGPKEIGSTTNNGVTTTVFRNPDGTLTTVSKDAQGNAVANPAPPIPPTVTTPPAAGPKEIGSTTNNGVTTTVFRNPDGTLTTVSKDAQGNAVANPAPPIPPTVTTPPPAAAGPKEIGSTTTNGVTTTVFRNPDGTLTTVSKDAQGNAVANPAPPIPPTVTTPPPAAAGPKEIGSTTTNGVTTTVFRNPDGTLTTVSKDAQGNAVANPAPPIPPTVTAPAVSNCPPGQACVPTNQTAAANAVASGATPQTPNSPGGTTTPAPQTNPVIGGSAPQAPTGGNPPTFNPAANAPELGNGGNSVFGAGALNFAVPNSFLLNATNTALNGIVVPMIQDVTVSLPATSASQSNPNPGANMGIAPRDPNARSASTTRRTGGWMQLAAFHPRDPLLALSPRGLLGWLGAPQPQVGGAGQLIYSLVANGNSSGEALELQVFDPSGAVKNPDLPEGMVLEPLKQGSAKPVSEIERGANILKKPLVAYCVDYAKLPPEAGMLYRLAPQAIQDKFSGIRQVLQAGRELAAAGKFHPDSDADAYKDSIRQYALWTKIGNWDQQKFGEVFLEKTQENAVAAKVKWTKQMAQVVSGFVPGRWRDISMVLDEASKLSGAPGNPNQIHGPPN